MKTKSILFLILVFILIVSGFNFSESQIRDCWEVIYSNEKMFDNTSVLWANFMYQKTIDALDENNIILCSKVINYSENNSYLNILSIKDKGGQINELYRIKLNISANDHSLHSLSYPSKNVIVVVGDSLIETEKFETYIHYGQITISRDGGETWEVQTLDSNYSLKSLSMLNENYGIILADYMGEDKDNDYLFITEDCWKTFDEIPLPEDYYLVNTYCLSENKFAIVCYDFDEQYLKLMISEDKGKTWEEIHNFGEHSDFYTIYKLIFIGNTIYGIGSNFYAPGSRTGFFYKSKDGGYTWTKRTLFEGEKKFIEREFLCFDFYDENNGIIITNQGEYLKTTDGGNNWIIEYSPNNFSLDTSLEYYHIRQLVYLSKDFALGNAQRGILKYPGKKVLPKPELIPLPFKAYQPVDSVTIRWKEVEGALKYRVIVTRDSMNGRSPDSFSNPYLDTIITGNSLTLKNLEHYMFYVGRMKAIGNGIESLWTKKLHYFTTLKKGFELIPAEFVSPEFYELNVPLDVDLKWRKPPNATHFSLSIYHFDYDGDPIFDETIDNITDTIYHLSNLMPNKYYAIGLKTFYDKQSSKSIYLKFFTKQTTSVKERTELINNLKIFPNPVGTNMMVLLDNELIGASKVEIYDLLGNLVYNSNIKIHDNIMNINISDLPPSNYFIILKNQANIYTGSFVKME